jgi:DNA-binding NtrC family response regulator
MANNRIQQSIVMVIDDDKASGARCEGLVDAVGACCMRVHSRADAEYALTQFVPDVILVASDLPDAHGIDLVSEYRNRRALRRTPMILICDELATNEMERAVMAGVFAALSKPFSAGEFFKLVTSAIGSDGRHTRRRAMDETRRI